MSLFGTDVDRIPERHEPETKRFKEPSDKDVLRRLKTSRQQTEGEYPVYRVYDPKGKRAVVKKRKIYSDDHEETFNLHRRCSPFAQAFVYEKGSDPVVLVGWSREVDLHISQLDRAIYHIVRYFSRPYSARTNKFWYTNTKLKIYSPRNSYSDKFTRRKHAVTHEDLGYELKFRTLPKKWLDEYDEMLRKIQSNDE